MMKKRIILMMLMASTILVLSACSSDNNDSNGSGDSDEPLKVWGMGAEGEKLADIATDFEDETGIEVKVQAIPWEKAKDKLLTAVASKKGPDILQEPAGWIPEFAESNTYMDLTEFFDNDDYPNLKKDKFNEAAMDSVQIDDKIQAMPWFVAVNGLFYRSDLLEDEGYPDGPQTQEDMLDAAKSLTERGDDQFGLGIPPKDFNIMFAFALRQGWTYEDDKGAENFKKPAFRNMMELYKTFSDEDLIPTTDQGKEPMVALKDGTQPMFFSGPYMVDLINEEVPDLEGKWDVKPVPKAENEDTFIGGTQLAVFHNTDKKDKAVQFLNYMADPDTQVKWFEESYSLPAVNDAWDDPALKEEEKLDTFKEQMEHTQLAPQIPEYEHLGEELANTMEKVIRGKADVDSAMDEFYKKAEDILE